MEIISWLLAVITGFLFSFAWKEIQRKIYYSFPIIEQLRKHGLLKIKGDPMEERLDDMEIKLNRIVNRLDELDEIKKSLVRLENIANESLKYLSSIEEIKSFMEEMKEGLESSSEEDENNEEPENELSEDEDEEKIDKLLLEAKTRNELSEAKKKAEAKLNIIEYVKNNKLEDLFKDVRFFPEFQEEIRKRKIKQSQAVIELLAIRKLPPLDLKAPMTEEFCTLIEEQRKMIPSIGIFADMINVIDLLIPSIANMAFAIILLATYQKDRIPEVFDIKEDFTVNELHNKLIAI